MPNIEQYTSPIDTLRPDDRGFEAKQMEGRHIEGAYNSIGESYKGIGRDVQQLASEIDQHVSQHQMLQGLATSTQFIGSQTQLWKQQYAADAANPSADPHLADKFMSTVQQNLDGMDGNFSTDEGKRWWAERKAQITQHFRETTTADQASLIGIQGVQNLDITHNQAVATSYMSPESVNRSLGDIDAATKLSISALGANADRQSIDAMMQHGAVAKRQATIAAARGLIDQAAPGNEGQAAKMALDLPAASQYLDEGDRQSVSRYAEEQGRVNVEKQRAQQLQVKEQNENEGKAYFSQLRAAMIDTDGNLHTSPELVEKAKEGAVKYGAYLPGEVDSTIGAIRQAHDREINHENINTNWDAFDKLSQGVTGGTLTQQAVDQAYINRQLSNTEYSHLTEMVTRVAKDPAEKELQKRIESFVTTNKAAILGTSIGSANPARHEKYYEFDTAIRSAVDTARAKGVTPQQIMDTFLNPSDKAHYMGYNSYAMNYYTGHATKTSAAVAAAPFMRPVSADAPGGGQAAPSSAPAARLPGETPQAYLARTGG